MFTRYGYNLVAIDLRGYNQSDGKHCTFGVKERNELKQPSTTVYLFNEPHTAIFGADPIFSNKKVVTNANGVAYFHLEDVFHLDAVEV